MADTRSFAVIAWIVLAGFYFLFAGEISTTEIIAGVPATIAAAWFAVRAHRERSRKLQLTAPWPRVLTRPLLALYPDAVRVGRVLLATLWRRPAGPAGLVTRQPFRQGTGNPADAGRRGLVTLAASLAPNGYVLNIPHGQDVLIMHRLAPAQPKSDREWPA